METNITSVQQTETTITFDIYYNKESYPFEAIYDLSDYSLKTVNSLGYHWKDLPERIMDEANEFAINYKEKL